VFGSVTNPKCLGFLREAHGVFVLCRHNGALLLLLVRQAISLRTRGSPGSGQFDPNSADWFPSHGAHVDASRLPVPTPPNASNLLLSPGTGRCRSNACNLVWVYFDTACVRELLCLRMGRLHEDYRNSVFFGVSLTSSAASIWLF
jgi:hypothetical protein